jgi:hypothetical protein
MIASRDVILAVDLFGQGAAADYAVRIAYRNGIAYNTAAILVRVKIQPMRRRRTALGQVVVQLHPDRLDRQHVSRTAIRQRRLHMPVARNGLIQKVVNDQRLFCVDPKFGRGARHTVGRKIIDLNAPLARRPVYRVAVPGRNTIGRRLDDNNLAGRVVVLRLFRSAAVGFGGVGMGC